jgi:outer membrane protein assembly factor BamB
MAAFVLMTGLLRAADWPQFRGSTTGVVNDAVGPVAWTREKHTAWTAVVPGYGWSSPIVWGDKVFVTSASSDTARMPKLKGPGGGESAPPEQIFRWQIHCLDANDGRLLWTQVAATHRPPIATHISNTYASETPVTDGTYVYAYFGMVGVYCFDYSGKQVWGRDLGSYRMFGNWGTSSSPTQDDKHLFIQCDNEERSFVVALDKATGAIAWRVDRPEKSTWGSPVLWRNKLHNELVLMGARRIRSYNPDTGAVLWELATQQGAGGERAAGGGPANRGGTGGPGGGGPGGGGARSAAGGCKSTPVATPDMIYLGMAPKVTGQQLGPMWAVKAGAAGDISLKAGETSNANVAWYRPDAGPHFASAVVYDRLLYLVPPHDGVLRCFDATTGADVYQERLPGAGDFKASMWAANGQVFAIDERGSEYVVHAGKEFSLVAQNALNESCWSTPAPAGNSIFFRSVERLICIRKSPEN